MKNNSTLFSILLVYALLTCNYTSKAASDSLKVYLKDQSQQIFPLDKLKRIEFKTSTGIYSESLSNIKKISNFPNPFSNQTTIEFTIDKKQDIKVLIFDLNGGLVKELYCNQCSEGINTIIWDGTNNKGEKLESASYYFQVINSSISSEEFLKYNSSNLNQSNFNKMLLIK